MCKCRSVSGHSLLQQQRDPFPASSPSPTAAASVVGFLLLPYVSSLAGTGFTHVYDPSRCPIHPTTQRSIRTGNMCTFLQIMGPWRQIRPHFRWTIRPCRFVKVSLTWPQHTVNLSPAATSPTISYSPHKAATFRGATHQTNETSQPAARHVAAAAAACRIADSADMCCCQL